MKLFLFFKNFTLNFRKIMLLHTTSDRNISQIHALVTHMTQTILGGLNATKIAFRTLLILEFSKPSMWFPELINKILNTHIHDTVKNDVPTISLDDKANPIYKDKFSTTPHYKNVLPQGSVSSLTLFNLFTHDIWTPTEPDSHVLSYDDHLTILRQRSKQEAAARQ